MKKIAFFSLVMAVLSSHAFAQQQKQPAIVLGSTPGSTVTRAQLLADPRITDRNNQYNVTSGQVTFAPNGRDIVGPFPIKGNTLSAATIYAIRKMATPANMVIEDISATGSDGQPRKLNCIVLKVID
jgi:hypothetical protein